MTLPTPPSATLDILPGADGSAHYSQNGYTVLGAVNAPIEVQRRDELPEEAAIEVNVRPAVGVGGVRERHLENIIRSTLRAIILTPQHPRSLIQLTLQTTRAPPDPEPSAPNSSSHRSPLPHLPALLQTALLALLAAAVPLATTYTSVLVAAPRSSAETPVADPSPTRLRDAASVHVLTFSARGELLLAESEGEFDVGVWERVFGEGERVCRGRREGLDMDVDGEGQGQGVRKEGLEAGLREVVGGKVEIDLRWRDGVM